MKLLILTQKIDKNDPLLGFFQAWITEFAKHCDEVTVIGLMVGDYELPKNVRVLSLGKEGGVSRMKYIFRFYRYIIGERGHYDAVFVHMNPIYVVLGGVLWKIMRKQIMLWFTHRNVDWQLRYSEKIADLVFTAAEQSFNIRSPKVHIVGHGIEVKKFIMTPKERKAPLEILHMGRITKIKNCDTLIETAALLKKNLGPISVSFAGETITKEDKDYKRHLDQLIIKYGLTDEVTFVPVGYDQVAGFFERSDITVNLTPTGGIDKAVLSGVIALRPTFVSNHAFVGIFKEHADRFIFKLRDPNDLSEKITAFLESKDQREVMQELSTRVQQEYSVERLIEKIMNIYETSR